MIPQTSHRVASGTIKINNGFIHIYIYKYSNIYKYIYIYIYIYYTHDFFKLIIAWRVGTHTIQTYPGKKYKHTTWAYLESIIEV